MLRDFFDFLGEIRDKFISSRILILGLLYAVLVVVLIKKLYNLQIVHGSDYQESYISMTERTIPSSAARGRIFDKNGNLLAYNELSYDVVVQDNGDYKEINDRNMMVYRLVRILQENNETIEGSLQIRLNENGHFEYTTSSAAARKSFLRDVLGLKSVNDLDAEGGKYSSSMSADDLIRRETEYFKLDKLTDESGNPVGLTQRQALDIINIRYTMSLTSYRRYEQTLVSADISEDTKIRILEARESLKGVDVIESSKRSYNDAVYFSSIIGYTGRVQQDQIEELQSTDPNYTLNDTVGRIGIEKYLEYELHGTKGEKNIYIDNVGRIKQVIGETEPVAGNDVYLTIDRDLQIGIYNLLERQLAGIVASKIVNEDNPNENVTDASKLLIPVKDAYYQLISNNVLDIDHFRSEEADENEQEIYRKFSEYNEKIMKEIRAELTGSNPKPLNQLDEDINQYMVYIYNKLSSEDVIVSDIIDVNKDYYLAWKADTISMRDFLYAGVSDNWLDSSALKVTSKYAAADDIFMALIDFIEESLKGDKDFEKLNYKYLIKKDIISGKELCLSLYAQNAIPFDKETYHTLLSNGNDYACQFLIDRISKIEITPAQLALDPCAAGCVVTDVNTGEVLALVSYPGYDNNELTGKMNTGYYYRLLNDQSLPLYNYATQAKKAPGSTFKPITAVAALEENVITPGDTVTCTGIYEEISPPIRCWTYPNFHGPLDIVGGIENSCNYFFNEMAHRLSTNDSGEYDTELGLEKIRKYATFFGLDHKSGVEVNETEPNISTISPEQSAMGQGSHSFSNIQLSRYVTTIANRGKLYELSVLDKLTDSKGKVVKDYHPPVTNQLTFKDSTWDLVQKGMHQVVTTGSARRIFSDLEVSIAGKTGTAQESKTRGNHAFFISFAPYEDPEIAVTVNIPYGYSSSNAATVARNVYRYYYGYMSFDDILTGGALGVYDVNIGD